MPLRVEPRRDRKLNRLIKAAELKSLRRGESLFEPGEPARSVYLVQSGFVRLVDAASGPVRSHTVAVSGPWELAGEEGLQQGCVRRYRGVAGESTSYRALDGGAVLGVIKSTEQTLSALLDGLLADLGAARSVAAGAGGLSATRRIAHVLLELARRWGQPQGSGVLVSQRLTHQVLADLAGAHRSTVTTTLNEWLYERILGAAARGIYIAKPERLRKVSAPSG